jgi:hypothetical protein
LDEKLRELGVDEVVLAGQHTYIPPPIYRENPNSQSVTYEPRPL